MKCIELNDELNERYNSFLQAHPHSMFYYTIKYRNFILSLIPKAKARYLLTINEKEEIEAICPLMEIEGTLGKVINSLPYFGSHGGILANSKEAEEFLMNHLNQYLNSQDVASYNIVSNPFLQNNIIPIHNETDERIGQITELPPSIEEFFKALNDKTRNGIRKAQKENIEVEVDNSKEAFEFLYKTHLENMSAIGGKPKAEEYFANTQKIFEAGKDYNLYIAKHEGKKIAGILLFYFKDFVEYFTPVCLAEFRNFQPTSLIIYKAMEEAINKNFKYWNWGGTWHEQKTVYDFKKKWLAKDFIYKYYVNIKNKSIYSTSKEELLTEYPNFYVINFLLLK